MGGGGQAVNSRRGQRKTTKILFIPPIRFRDGRRFCFFLFFLFFYFTSIKKIA
jgi:hypothetical protein